MNDEYSARTSGRRGWAVAVGLGTALLVASVPAVRHLRELPPPPALPIRMSWTAPGELNIGGGSEHPFGLALSPDGRRAVFPAARDGRIELWLQDLRSGAVQAVPNTERGVAPFWSPDGGAIGFFSDGALKMIALEDARVTELAQVARPRGATWGASGIVYTNAQGGLTLSQGQSPVSAGGQGGLSRLTTVDETAGEIAHLFPSVVPGGAHVVCFVRAEAPARQGLYLVSLADGRMTRLTGAASSGVAAGDQVIFAVDGALVRQTLDLAERRLTGPVTVLAPRVGQSPAGHLLAAAAADVLVFSEPISVLHEIVWLSRTGERLAAVGSPADIWTARVAPDGRRVAATILEPLLRTLDIAAFDGRTLMPTRISLSIDTDEWPAWSPDGLRMAWVQAGRTVMVRGAGAVLPAETLRRFDEPVRVTGWTPDGIAVIVSRTMPGTREDLWLVPRDDAREPRPLVATPFADVQGVISPDGRRVAYASDESGRFEIYVETLADRSPGPATRERVSSGGGSDPRWSRDGQELFFRRGSEIHVATPALGRGQNAVAATSMLFETKLPPRSFDAAPDGRFLLVLPVDTPAPPATVILNWAQPNVTTSGP